MKPAAVILAGGKSLRFGEDKALFPFRGRPMISYLIETIKTEGFDIWISSNHTAHAKLGCPILRDRRPFCGPLHALCDILEALVVSKILLVPCDTPLLQPAWVRRLWAESENREITVFEEVPENPSPLPGVYARSLLPKIREAIRRGDSSLRSLLGQKTETRVLFTEKNLPNINTKGDLASNGSGLISVRGEIVEP